MCFGKRDFQPPESFVGTHQSLGNVFVLFLFSWIQKRICRRLFFFFVFFFWTFEWSTFYYTTATNSSSTTSYSLYSSLLTGWVHTYYGHLITVYTTYVFLVLGGRCKWCMSLSFFTISLFFFFNFCRLQGGSLYSDCPNRWKTPEFPFTHSKTII